MPGVHSKRGPVQRGRLARPARVDAAARGPQSDGPFDSLGAVACLHALTRHLHASGPIATVIAGLLSGSITAPRVAPDLTASVRTFWTGLDELLNALLFVFVG